MKKNLLTITLLFLCCWLAACGNALKAAEHTAQVRGFFDSYVSGQALLSDNTEEARVSLSADATASLFTLSGTIWGKDIRISAPVTGSQITEMTDTCGNYDIRCLRQLENGVRIIVSAKDSMDISYIDVPMADFGDAGIEDYNPFWYTGFVAPQIESLAFSGTAAEPEPLRFRSTTTVFDAIVEEYLSIPLAYHWDTRFTGTGLFTFTCGAPERYSLYQPADGPAETWNDSTLTLMDAQLQLGTPNGDYIRRAQATIPASEVSRIQNPSADGNYSFPAASGSKLTQLTISWDAAALNSTAGQPPEISLDVDVMYNDPAAVHDTSKPLSSLWTFRVASTSQADNGTVSGMAKHMLEYQTYVP